MGSNDFSFKKITGFEATEFAYLNASVVWTGTVTVDHPRNVHAPWQAPAMPVRGLQDTMKLRSRIDGLRIERPKGLMLWFLGKSIAFPFASTAVRFDAVAQSIQANDAHALLLACKGVLGLGAGLTPSGDDFLGGLLFCLGHLPGWRDTERLSHICWTLQTWAENPVQPATNPISAALMGDLMNGKGYRPVHQFMHGLANGQVQAMQVACDDLERLGSSSGFDILAGMLTAITNVKTEYER